MIIRLSPQVNSDRIIDILIKNGYYVSEYSDHVKEIHTDPITESATETAGEAA